MILIDAFSRVYCSKNYTPFLHELADNGIFTPVEPLFAFRGIEATIFTGVWPNIHNVWTEFCLVGDPTHVRENWLLKHLVETVNLLPNDEFKVKLRYAIERYLFRKSHKTPNLIPAAAMHYFETSLPKEIIEDRAINGLRTLFDILREEGVEFVFVEPWVSGDRGVLNKAKKLIKQRSHCPFFYMKFNGLDHLGHRYGPNPSAFGDELARMDMYVEQLVTLLLRENPKLNVLILADHGMSKVHKNVNILAGLDQLRSRMYKDYVLFADSTMIRFWFFKKEAKREVCKYLLQSKHGHILTRKEKELLKTPLDPKYGQIIYVVDEGYVIHPCFFHLKSTVKGMHGYAYSKTTEALPILISNEMMAKNFQSSKSVTYNDILPSLLYSLGFCKRGLA